MEDLIKREDAIKAVLGLTMYKGCVPVDSVIFNIKNIPSTEPTIEIDADQLEKLLREGWTIHSEPKQGEWISLHNGKWKCSECGIEVLFYAKGNFCPNCGARMKGADDESLL